MSQLFAGYYGEAVSSVTDQFEEALSYISDDEIHILEEKNCTLLTTGDYSFKDDTKVIVNGHIHQAPDKPAELVREMYNDQGKSFPDDLTGAYRAAIYDSRKDELILIKEKIGRRRIYYSPMDNGMAFASHMSAILSHPNIDNELDPITVRDFIISRPASLSGGSTLIKDVKKLFTGEILTADSEGFETQRFWDIYDIPKIDASDEYVAKKAEELVSEGIKRNLRCVEDDEINVFFSGGYDSTALTSLIKRNTDKEIVGHTYAREPQHFESAQRMSEYLDIGYNEIELPLDKLTPQTLWRMDEPLIECCMSFPHRLKEKLNFESAFYGCYAEFMFPYQNQPIRLLEKVRKFGPAFKALNRTGLDKKIDQATQLRLRAGTNVLSSPYHSAIEVHAGSPPGFDEKDWLSEKYRNIDRDLAKVVDERWNLRKKPYPDNYQFLRIRDFNTAQMAGVWEPFQFHTPYGYTELIEFARSVPAHQKKNQRILGRISRGHLPDDMIDKPPSGNAWTAKNIFQPLIEANQHYYWGSIESFVRRGFLDQKMAENYLHPSTLTKANRSRVIFMLKLWMLEQWIRAYVEREEPWKPPA